MLLAGRFFRWRHAIGRRPRLNPHSFRRQSRARQRAAELPESMQRHWTFLNRIRQDDAFSGFIHRTMLNEENQLGVVLFSSVKPERSRP